MENVNTENNNTEIVIIKRTHKKPYKVGKLYFGRRGSERGAGWVVSANEDLSSPLETFEIGKLARAYCEEVRDQEKAKSATASVEVDVNIPAGSGFNNIFDNTSEEIV